MVLALILLIAVLQIIALVTMPRQNPVVWTPGGDLLSAEDHKALALQLEDKNLPEAAAEAWAAYFREADLTGTEAAKVLLQIGKLKQDSGDYEGAIHEYYLAERLIGPADEDLARTVAMRVRECFRKLGQYSELSREVAERASDATEATTLSGQQVVAEVAGDKITVADFERLAQQQLELSIQSQWGLTPGEADAIRQRAHDRLSDPAERVRHLQQMLITRVLAEEARKQGLQESTGFRERMMSIADSTLAATLIGSEIEKRGTITPKDVERYYEANRDRYVEPAQTQIARIVCPDQQTAADLITRAQDGESFEELAGENSLDPQTRDSGGLVERPVRRDGDLVPGVGRNAELHASIWAAEPGDVLPEPVETSQDWLVIQVVERTEAVQRTLDEVRDRVEYDTQLARQQEVTEQYIQQLFEASGVRMYPQAFSMQGGQTDDETE
jgi:peptidyl-prolyl cis-trans isomerase C